MRLPKSLVPTLREDPADAEAISHKLMLRAGDRKSTRLNYRHSQISYAVFCLNKKHSEKLEQSALHAVMMCTDASKDFDVHPHTYPAPAHVDGASVMNHARTNAVTLYLKHSVS